MLLTIMTFQLKEVSTWDWWWPIFHLRIKENRILNPIAQVPHPSSGNVMKGLPSFWNLNILAVAYNFLRSIKPHHVKSLLIILMTIWLQKRGIALMSNFVEFSFKPCVCVCVCVSLSLSLSLSLHSLGVHQSFTWTTNRSLSFSSSLPQNLVTTSLQWIAIEWTDPCHVALPPRKKDQPLACIFSSRIYGV